MVTCQRGSRGCLSTGHRLARACRQAESFGPTSSWARCSTTHYLTHPQLLDLAEEMGRFETLTSVLGYCGSRFGEAAALRRKDVGDREITVRASATYVAGHRDRGNGTPRPNGRVAYRCLNLSPNAWAASCLLSPMRSCSRLVKAGAVG